MAKLGCFVLLLALGLAATKFIELEVESGSLHFQNLRSGQIQIQAVKFEKQFSRIPQVALGSNNLISDSLGDIAYFCKVQNVTTEGFVLEVMANGVDLGYVSYQYMAILDDRVQIDCQNLELQSADFMIPFKRKHVSLPEVGLLVTGFHQQGEVVSLAVEIQEILLDGVKLTAFIDGVRSLGYCLISGDPQALQVHQYSSLVIQNTEQISLQHTPQRIYGYSQMISSGQSVGVLFDYGDYDLPYVDGEGQTDIALTMIQFVDDKSLVCEDEDCRQEYFQPRNMKDSKRFKTLRSQPIMLSLQAQKAIVTEEQVDINFDELYDELDQMLDVDAVKDSTKLLQVTAKEENHESESTLNQIQNMLQQFSDSLDSEDKSQPDTSLLSDLKDDLQLGVNKLADEVGAPEMNLDALQDQEQSEVANTTSENENENTPNAQERQQQLEQEIAPIINEISPAIADAAEIQANQELDIDELNNLIGQDTDLAVDLNDINTLQLNQQINVQDEDPYDLDLYETDDDQYSELPSDINLHQMELLAKTFNLETTPLQSDLSDLQEAEKEITQINNIEAEIIKKDSIEEIQVQEQMPKNDEVETSSFDISDQLNDNEDEQLNDDQYAQESVEISLSDPKESEQSEQLEDINQSSNSDSTEMQEQTQTDTTEQEQSKQTEVRQEIEDSSSEKPLKFKDSEDMGIHKGSNQDISDQELDSASEPQQQNVQISNQPETNTIEQPEVEEKIEETEEQPQQQPNIQNEQIEEKDQSSNQQEPVQEELKLEDQSEQESEKETDQSLSTEELQQNQEQSISESQPEQEQQPQQQEQQQQSDPATSDFHENQDSISQQPEIQDEQQPIVEQTQSQASESQNIPQVQPAFYKESDLSSQSESQQSEESTQSSLDLEQSSTDSDSGNILSNIAPIVNTKKEEQLDNLFNQENSDSEALDDFEAINQKVFNQSPEYNLDSSSEDQQTLIVAGVENNTQKQSQNEKQEQVPEKEDQVEYDLEDLGEVQQQPEKQSIESKSDSDSQDQLYEIDLKAEKEAQSQKQDTDQELDLDVETDQELNLDVENDQELDSNVENDQEQDVNLDADTDSVSDFDLGKELQKKPQNKVIEKTQENDKDKDYYIESKDEDFTDDSFKISDTDSNKEEAHLELLTDTDPSDIKSTINMLVADVMDSAQSLKSDEQSEIETQHDDQQLVQEDVQSETQSEQSLNNDSESSEISDIEGSGSESSAVTNDSDEEFEPAVQVEVPPKAQVKELPGKVIEESKQVQSESSEDAGSDLEDYSDIDFSKNDQQDQPLVADTPLQADQFYKEFQESQNIEQEIQVVDDPNLDNQLDEILHNKQQLHSTQTTTLPPKAAPVSVAKIVEDPPQIVEQEDNTEQMDRIARMFSERTDDSDQYRDDQLAWEFHGDDKESLSEMDSDISPDLSTTLQEVMQLSSGADAEAELEKIQKATLKHAQEAIDKNIGRETTEQIIQQSIDRQSKQNKLIQSALSDSESNDVDSPPPPKVEIRSRVLEREQRGSNLPELPPLEKVPPNKPQMDEKTFQTFEKKMDSYLKKKSISNPNSRPDLTTDSSIEIVKQHEESHQKRKREIFEQLKERYSHKDGISKDLTPQKDMDYEFEQAYQDWVTNAGVMSSVPKKKESPLKMVEIKVVPHTPVVHKIEIPGLEIPNLEESMESQPEEFNSFLTMQHIVNRNLRGK